MMAYGLNGFVPDPFEDCTGLYRSGMKINQVCTGPVWTRIQVHARPVPIIRVRYAAYTGVTPDPFELIQDRYGRFRAIPDCSEEKRYCRGAINCNTRGQLENEINELLVNHMHEVASKNARRYCWRTCLQCLNAAMRKAARA